MLGVVASKIKTPQMLSELASSYSLGAATLSSDQRPFYAFIFIYLFLERGGERDEEEEEAGSISLHIC